MTSWSDPLFGVEKGGSSALTYKPWWQEGLFFSCVRCGRCCRGEPGSVWLSPGELEAIAGHLRIGSEAFLKDFAIERRGRISLRERPNWDCVMYRGESARCGIYNVRPLQCRLFPFWPSILRTRRGWLERSKDCPGMGRGRFWSAEEIADLLAKSPFPDL